MNPFVINKKPSDSALAIVWHGSKNKEDSTLLVLDFTVS